MIWHMTPDEQFDKKYATEQVIRRGPFDVIYKGRNIATGQAIAIRASRSNRIDPAVQKLMSVPRHRNIAELHHASVNKEINQTRWVMELCEGGDLGSLIKWAVSSRPEKPLDQQSPCLSPVRVLQLARELASGMAHLHSHRLMHRNLKPSGILLDRDGTLKIGAFSHVGETEDSDIYQPHKYRAVGTLLYAPPEIVNNAPYSAKCDVWCAGLVLYEMLAGKPYFITARDKPHLSRLQSALKERPAAVPEIFGTFLQKTIQSMLSYDEADRPSFHELIANIDKEMGIYWKEH